ncbi:MAG: hypothetical protein GX632_03580 [Propioniciclava sp.]|nr:hypothetical protein [Propioniciclava sp.]
MPVMIFTMLIVLVLAAAIIAVVVMGMEGTGRRQHPEIAEAMARTARHLNGEGEPPRALVQLFDEIDEVPDLNVRDLPDKLRNLRSAASARSAWSALSARSAASANPPEAPEGEAPTGVDAPEVWAPTAPEASGVDESAAQAMSDALSAPAPQGLDDDPYGVFGITDPEHDPAASADEASAADDLAEPAEETSAEASGEPGEDAVNGDTVVRVRLPEGEPRA